MPGRADTPPADAGAGPRTGRRQRRRRKAQLVFLDGPDLPAAQERRVLELLRAEGRPAGLRRQPGRDR